MIGPALITLGVLSAISFYFVTRKVLEAHRDSPSAGGTEEMIGASGRSALGDRPRGPGLHAGHALERPPGRRRSPVGLGDRVRVEAVDGLTLVVRPDSPAAQAPKEGVS